MPDLDYAARFAQMPDVMQMAVFCVVNQTADCSQDEKKSAIDFLQFMAAGADLPEQTQRICGMVASLVITIHAAAETGSAAITADPTP